MTNRSILLLKPLQGNEKKEDSADGFFSQLSEILKGKRFVITAEIAIFGKYLWFFITCPQFVRDTIRGQWNSYYPDCEIQEIKDYTDKLFTANKSHYYIGTELYLKHTEMMPLKTYKDLEKNPLVSLSGIASSFQKSESGYIQLILEPPKRDNWIEDMQKKRRHTRRESRSYKIPEKEGETYIDLEAEKEEAPYFRTTIRFLTSSTSLEKAKLNLTSLTTVYTKSLERPRLQKLKVGNYKKGQDIISLYKSRSIGNKSIINNLRRRRGIKFSSAELATIFHLPHKDEEISQIVEVQAKKAPPPQNLPVKGEPGTKDAPFFGETNFRSEKLAFSIKIPDRRRHLYIIGKSGMGKSKLLELLIKEDIQHGHGVILIDPHGDLSKTILNYVPDERINDVVYFDPTDKEYPIGFNPMQGVSSFEFKQNIVNGFINIFKKFFGLNWNERFEHVLRYTTLALLDYPQASILGIPRMLTDNMFRQEALKYVTDPLVKKFWTTEFSGWNDQYANEAIVPIINKIGRFVSNPTIRNIVGQEKSGFSLEKIMNEKKILLTNFSIGTLGEENSALLGSMMVTKIWEAAFARAAIAEDKRIDTFLYVDEFQNFATSTFANIFSEARKYKLNLTVAHQYMQQLTQEVRSTIFGNVSNMISFRVGGDDAPALAKEFEPVFEVNDFLNLDLRNFLIKMSVDGQTSRPFSAQTLWVDKVKEDKADKIIAHSRKKWGRQKADVEAEIAKWDSGQMVPEKFAQEVSKIETKSHTEIKSPEPQMQLDEDFFPEPLI